MKPKKIILAGGTGFIGQAMARYFGMDNHVVSLSRHGVNGHNNRYNHQLVKSADGYNINGVLVYVMANHLTDTKTSTKIFRAGMPGLGKNFF